MYLYSLLEEQYHLQRVSLSASISDPQLQDFVFISPKANESPGTLVVLIQDRGTVRCGQWSWRMIASRGLEWGSQLSYVRRALTESWEVLMMNPNQSSSPEEHVSHVWERVISRCPAKHVSVVVHGYGGVAFVDLLSRQPQDVQGRVHAVAFVDSSHNPWHQLLDADSRDWLKSKSRKWVLSPKPLNRPVGSLKAECPQLSAGTQCHEAAPAACVDAVFRFFTKMLRNRSPPVPFDIVTRSRSHGAARAVNSPE
ncbi:cotranscriptional regulator FAM172A homolog isoform X2 [Brienomyrus brachyistius]|nr:cotranscriptional regulator FAM172A homolog isoform X2 [Brienomyrus brachyistius]